MASEGDHRRLSTAIYDPGAVWISFFVTLGGLAMFLARKPIVAFNLWTYRLLRKEEDDFLLSRRFYEITLGVGALSIAAGGLYGVISAAA